MLTELGLKIRPELLPATATRKHSVGWYVHTVWVSFSWRGRWRRETGRTAGKQQKDFGASQKSVYLDRLLAREGLEKLGVCKALQTGDTEMATV